MANNYILHKDITLHNMANSYGIHRDIAFHNMTTPLSQNMYLWVQSFYIICIYKILGLNIHY